ncbi:SDR family NAD(P)-dependent oxidoreductase [Frankia sp. CNm7]|uniref:SDR family NAD(P)-dependent oxidoreductase n=1 Tax=Frankia nepalensis TaxID=1836974 RepID=A0A937UN34_9ACTN|nr:SDR family NAD(P)-dependent oxidoreductase [Frankia nepalensis]MBL7496524.1 SDR family NAD(P)-dependent oxidoreductase [Frankia nepalensis]MBL7508743.1 SDR family NAD(P)-dependent oxidoreductase [Frankia nepalensis]MBL7523794.1 SDR family NAD(P)-dependent oxidoreductase [Frankia nepalensis]MBL7627497.1 SDR family NAD(P)-dependent oxidoreductase [Frankia nepalensis]
MKTFEDRVAVVTGAASGIGLAVAERLALAGVRLVMTDLDGDAVDAAGRALRDRGSAVEALQLDVRDPDAVERVAELVVRRFGALHIAVNNAGIVNRGLAWELSLADWHRVLDVNLWGVIHGVRSFVPRIVATGDEGHVVNVASMAAVHPQERLGPYTVAKHGVLGLSDVLRADLAAVGAPVGVSVVFPGRIRTAMNPIGSVEPSTVARNVFDAIEQQRPYVFTDDHSAGPVEARLQGILSARADVIP